MLAMTLIASVSKGLETINSLIYIIIFPCTRRHILWQRRCKRWCRIHHSDNIPHSPRNRQPDNIVKWPAERSSRVPAQGQHFEDLNASCWVQCMYRLNQWPVYRVVSQQLQSMGLASIDGNKIGSFRCHHQVIYLMNFSFVFLKP